MGPAELPLVIGVGNDARRDDGVGLAVARAVRPRLLGRARIEECPNDATALLSLWEGAGVVLVADAVRSGSPPGSLRRIDVDASPLPVAGATSTHGLSLSEAVGLGRTLGRRPERLVVYGIEAGDLGPGAGLSAPVAGAVGPAAGWIALEVLSLVGSGSSTGGGDRA